MRCFFLLLLLVLLLHSSSAVRIPIYGKQFVKLYVGNPGKTITFRLRHDLNQSYIYDAQPQQYSDTYTSDSDVVYFNDRYIRLKFFYGIVEPDQRLSTATNIPYGGVLALGSGSDIWTYWPSFTRSKFVLTLGGDLDCLDCAAGAKALQYTLEDPITAETECGLSAETEDAVVYPLELRISDDYTYLPATLFTTLDVKPRQQLSIVRIDNTAPQCPVADSSLESAANRQIVLSVDSDVNFIYTPYNSKENLLRISETNIQQPVTGIAIGVIMLMEDAVLYVDFVTRKASVVKAFYSYPRTPFHVATFIPFIAVLLTLWWFVETHPMFVQWTKELFFRFAVILPISKLRTARSFAEQSNDNEATNLRQRRKLVEAAAASIIKSPSSDTSEIRAKAWTTQFKRQYIQAFSSIDWETVAQLLSLTRLLVLATVFVAVFGLESHRFVYRTMSWLSIDPAFGTVLFYILIVQLFVFSALVTESFTLRYPAAANALVQYMLFMCVWVAQLHERDTNLLDQFISLIVCTAAVTRLLEWVFWNAIRGPDWVYEKTVALNDLENGLGNSQSELTGGRAMLIYLWIFVFLPFGITLLIVGNVLPLVEFLWPGSPVRLSIAWFYVLTAVIFMALVNVSNLSLSVYRSLKDRYVQEWEAYKKQKTN